ncbi:MAG: hypothetical protein ACHP84_14610 [Caulobacterales bacterium]
MRLNSILAWPPVTFEPARREDRSRKTKAADESAEPHAVQPIPQAGPRTDEKDKGDSPGIDIIA